MNRPLLQAGLVHFPLNLPGNVYGSPMPFGLYDPDGNLFPKMNAPRIQVVVPLDELEECRQNTGRDLLSLYRDHGLLVLHLPIPNYGVPSNGVVAFMGSGFAI